MVHAQSTLRRLAAGLLAGSTASLVLALSPAGPLNAHDWYPRECCNDQDCFRVDRMERMPDGSLRLNVAHFTVDVPAGFPARLSQDSDAHVCVYRDARGRYLPRCLFLPGEA